MLGVRTVAILEIDRERKLRGAVERRHVLDHLIQRRLSVPTAEREGEAGAGGGKRLEAVRRQHSRRARIPRVRHHECFTGMQRPERARLLRLPSHW